MICAGCAAQMKEGCVTRPKGLSSIRYRLIRYHSLTSVMTKPPSQSPSQLPRVLIMPQVYGSPFRPVMNSDHTFDVFDQISFRRFAVGKTALQISTVVALAIRYVS